MSRSSDYAIVDDLADDRDPLIDVADVFGLLSDPGRLRLLTVLLASESSVGRLAELAGLSESSASHALRLLRAHRIVAARRVGRMVYYRLADEHVRQLLEIARQHAQHDVVLPATEMAR
jgi:DNA-binding transcriptional ArsR family regulator